MISRPGPVLPGMNMTNASTARAGRREWIVLAVIALPCLLYSMDLSVLYPRGCVTRGEGRRSRAMSLPLRQIWGAAAVGCVLRWKNATAIVSTSARDEGPPAVLHPWPG